MELAARNWYHCELEHLVEAELPRHKIWQAPFVMAKPSSTLEQRIESAMRLWCRNLDLLASKVLILRRTDINVSYACIRAFRAGDTAQIIGPVNHALIENGIQLFGLPLVFVERH